MAKARAITKRRKAVRNIRKITQTMQLIATARFQKCMQRAVASQPYTRRITALIQTLGRSANVEHPLLAAAPQAQRRLALVITSNRGLCGSYNAGVLRTLLEYRRNLGAAADQLTLEVVGKKGLNYCKFLGVPVAERITDVDDRIAFERVQAMATRYMARFTAGEFARVDVIYMQFVSVGSQRPVVAQLLPIERPTNSAASTGGEAPARGGASAGPAIEFEFSPPPAELLGRLIPEAVKVRLFQCFNDAIVSEQVARMVAMKAATDAAGDMIKYLTRDYNRARQSQITMELADIVGGANAVQ